MQRAITTLLFAAGLALPALGDGLHKERVPAGARAVVHVDVEALLASRLVDELKQADPDVDVDFDLGELTPLLQGVRPLQDVRSVTVFASDPAQERFGVVLRTSDKADALLQVAIATDAYELVGLGGWQVHSWSDGAQRVWGAVVPLGEGADRIVLISNDPQLMSDGIAVLDGSGASLATRAKGELAARPDPGAILFVASDLPLTELSSEDPSSSVARLVQGLVLQVGEAQGSVFAKLSLLTAQVQDAQRVQQILQGLTALASLVSDDAEQGQALRRLVGGLSFQATGNRLYAEFHYELAALLQDLQALEGSL
jgi:hypothetical protein